MLMEHSGLVVGKMPIITEIVSSTDVDRRKSGLAAENLLPLWQIGSGFAHGKEWAMENLTMKNEVAVMGNESKVVLSIPPLLAGRSICEVMTLLHEVMDSMVMLCNPNFQAQPTTGRL
jgi:hypothetical protein